MPEAETYYKITINDAHYYNPHEIRITKKVVWLAQLWDDPVCGESRARTLIMQVAGQGDTGISFLKNMRTSINRQQPVIKEEKMRRTLEAISREITRYVGRL